MIEIKRKSQMPFTSIDGRDYRSMYADAFKLHTKHSPPELDLTGEPGGYWWTVNTELIQLATKYGNDEFMKSLLLAVFAELEREYKALKERQRKIV